MCGIIGYIGKREADKILISGLEKLEYRGYDSAGVAVANNNELNVYKTKGRVSNLQSISLPGQIGIAHTRWSTHGSPSDKNAHPFLDEKKQFAIVHNGIIENHLELKEELRTLGINFTSDTDSEVIAHLVSINYQGNLKEAIIKTIDKLKGAYAFCVIKNDTQEMIGARNGSPLVIGIGKDENFLASDVSAIVEHTKNVIYVNDFEIVHVTKNTCDLYDFEGEAKDQEIKTINWDLEQAQKEGFKHFMLKEIYQQPGVVKESLNMKFNLLKPKKIILLACGTASYAGYIGKYLIEKLARIPVINAIASEFRYENPIVEPNDLVITISQSGETADTLAAMRLAKQKGAITLGLINVVDSTIAREADNVIYTKAGPEIGVASTKAFISQITSMYLLAYHLAGKEFYPQNIVKNITETLELDEKIKELAKKYYYYHDFLYMGRNTNYPLALEGALKLKEISYIHAEAYPAGELKHGPIALVSAETPTFVICPQDDVYEKTLSNIEEIKSRNGKVIAIGTFGDEKIKGICDDVIFVPKVDSILYPLVCIIPLQLFAYHMADYRECDIDKPRNLAKSVTVE
jgi:glutamine---fructose-6-phosphate transaminase (isomerizing)